MSGIKTSEKNVLIVGVVRNIASTLELDIARLRQAFSGFNKIFFFLVESDSNDKSIKILHEMSVKEPDFKFVSLGSLKEVFPLRTERLAHARNSYLEAFEKEPQYKDCEFLAVTDFNNLNKLLNREAIDEVFADSYWSVRTANQTGPYYDIWALRHPLWSPNDCWEDLEFLRQYVKFPELALYASVNSRMIRIPADSNPIVVESAFGGLAIYKREVLLGKRYSGIGETGREICEHVSLNLAITRERGIIEVFPPLINMYKTDHTRRFGIIKSIIRISAYLPKYVFKTLK